MSKVAVVTGGTSGIGRATALALKDAGYTVYELSRRAEGVEGLHHIAADVTDQQAVNDAVAQMRFARDDDVYYPHALQQYKLAIYCARYFQNPLSEVAALYNNPLDPDDCDLLQLELNPYQSVIPPSFLRKTLVMEICNELVSAGVVLQDVMAYLDGYCGYGMGVSSDSARSVPPRLRLP